jgi:glycosyltransferase involved in cell wall biosynthesis
MSGEIHQKLIEAGCDARHVFDIPNGVSLQTLNSIPRQTAAQRVRDRYGLPRDAALILTVGRNVPVKRFDRIPGMIASLRRVRKDFVWVMVGPGCDCLVQACADHGVADAMRVLGPFSVQLQNSPAGPSFPSPEMVEMFRASDLFALPTQMEGMPMVVLEAMAAGLPAVSMDVPGVRDLVDSGVNGFLSRDGDFEDMTRNLNTLLSDSGLRTRMGVEAARKARAFDWPRVAEQYLHLYSRAAAAAPC